MPTISIIVPAFNAQKTVAECLKSIFDQTFKDFEVIIVNDGSTDKTLEILNKFQDRVKIINQKNRGASAARNRGAKEATAPFIIFLDADIVMKKTMLEKMYRALNQRQEPSYAYSAFKFGFKTFKLFPFKSGTLRHLPYIHTSSLIRRGHFPGFDISLKKFQDWDLWLTMLDQGHKGYFIPEILFQVKPGGTMSTWLPSFVHRWPVFKKLKLVQQYNEAREIIKQKHNLS